MIFKFKLDWHEIFVILVLLSMIGMSVRNRWISGKTYIKFWNKMSVAKVVFGLILILLEISMLIYMLVLNSSDDFYISISGLLVIIYLIFTGINMPQLCENGILTSMDLIKWSKIKSMQWKGSFLRSISFKELVRGKFVLKNLEETQKNLFVIHTEEVSALGISNQTHKVNIPINKKGIANEIIKNILASRVEA